jgi:diphosphomevalonate decarboxylase
MEASALKMHATMLAAKPPFTYMRPASLAAIQAIWDARARGLEGYLTMDAGPNVKLLCAAADAPAWQACLAALPEVVEVLVCAPGPGVA